MIGRVLGERYRIVRSIGRGGMGAVFEAIDQPTGARVAIKVLLDELALDPTCAERFRREAMLAASLSHPSLVAVRDVSIDASPAFLVMELVTGKSLSRLLAEEGRIPWRRVLALARDVLTALEVVHGAGIVHRDLKPANVLVEADGDGERARLIDLGVAQLTTGAAYRRLTASGAIVGTPAYMSPEQLSGAPVGPASDLWSVGVLLHECLVGARPFPADDLAELIRGVATGEPERIERLAPDVPPAVADAVRALLHKAPEERPRSAKAAAQMLSDLLAAPVLPLAAPAEALRAESLAGLSDERSARPRVAASDGVPTRDAPASAAASAGPSTPRSLGHAPGLAASAPGVGVVSPGAAPHGVQPAVVPAVNGALPPARSRAWLGLAGAGLAGAVLTGALGLTCVLGVVIAYVAGDPRAWALPWAPPPTSTTTAPPTIPPVAPGPSRVDFSAHQLVVGLDGPDDYGDAASILSGTVPACIPLAGRRPGPVFQYVVWLERDGAVERFQRSTDTLTATERECVDLAIRRVRWPAPRTSFPAVNVFGNATW